MRLGDFGLYYEVHGDGPAVVFAHGAGGTHMSWWQQVPALSRHFRCITFDHRGFGYSRDVPNGPGRGARRSLSLAKRTAWWPRPL